VRRAAALLLPWALGCAAGSGVPPSLRELPASDEETRRAADEIRRELGEGFLVELVEGIFFAATDDTAENFARHRATIALVFRFLRSDYLKRIPSRPVRVYLFRDRRGYEGYCRAAYGEPPSTPFGFYRAGERKIVLDISTGGGTLAHEIVHPLLAEDFPGVPSWLNEGFASLFERFRERDGAVEGRPNWRLPVLQRALRDGRAPGLRRLLESPPNEFYGDERGVSYAAARHLCLWLQERGLLARFYREFRDGAAADPSGLRTLERVAGRALADLERDWTAWVRDLRPGD
jgi:hypothetical protein